MINARTHVLCRSTLKEVGVTLHFGRVMHQNRIKPVVLKHSRRSIDKASSPFQRASGVGSNDGMVTSVTMRYFTNGYTQNVDLITLRGKNNINVKGTVGKNFNVIYSNDRQISRVLHSTVL